MRNPRRVIGIALCILIFVFSFAGLQAMIGGNTRSLILATIIFGGIIVFADLRWDLFASPARPQPRRILQHLPYVLLLTLNPIYVVLRMQHLHTAAVVAALAALALVGAALMTLAERYHEHRMESHGYRAIPVRRCVLYAVTIVAIAAALTTTGFVLPPFIFGVAALAHVFAMAWVLGALEERRFGRTMDA